jgi:hypothetical protein
MVLPFPCLALHQKHPKTTCEDLFVHFGDTWHATRNIHHTAFIQHHACVAGKASVEWTPLNGGTVSSASPARRSSRREWCKPLGQQRCLFREFSGSIATNIWCRWRLIPWQVSVSDSNFKSPAYRSKIYQNVGFQFQHHWVLIYFNHHTLGLSWVTS